MPDVLKDALLSFLDMDEAGVERIGRSAYESGPFGSVSPCTRSRMKSRKTPNG